MKNLIIGGVIIIIIALGGYLLFKSSSTSIDNNKVPTPSTPVATGTSPTEEVATTTPVVPVLPEQKLQESIGTSAGGHDIVAYHYGTGDKEILFVGGIHGGYEWNTSLVAYELMDYLAAHPSAISQNERITIIPVLNPDGLNKITGKDGRFTVADIPSASAETVPGRYNAHNVDLNRNFACDWQAKGVWQNTTVSGGTAAFSEPESVAIHNYVTTHAITAAVVWYSAAGGVYASNCHNGVLTETATLMSLYARGSGYAPYEAFDYYAITGDMVNWFAEQKIPAISVLLTNHTDTEWTKNLAGVQAVLTHYAP